MPVQVRQYFCAEEEWVVMTSARQGSVLLWKKERRVLNVLFVGSAHSCTEHAPCFCSCGTDHTFENLQGQHNRALWWKSS